MTDSRPSYKLAAFQEDFVEEFISDKKPRVWHLQAQPGTGKTFTSVELVRRMLAEDCSDPLRVLVVAPAALAHHWRQALSERVEGDAFVRLLDRAELIKGFSGSPLTPLPLRCAYIVSNTFLRREDVFESVAAKEWELVIVDEAHQLGGDQRLGGRVMECKNFKRVLLISPVELALEEIERVHVFQVPQPNTAYEESAIYYALSLEERMVFALLEGMTDHVEVASRRMQASALRKLAESSFFALYESVARKLESSSASEVDVVQIDYTKEYGEAEAMCSSRCAELLSILDTIDVDSKASAMVRELRHGADNKRINIHTQYARTASYLGTVLSDEGFSVIVLSCTHRATEVEELLARLEAGSILITTDAFLTGRELPSAAIVVEYDRPDSQAIGFMRRTKYRPREGESTRWLRLVRSVESEFDGH